MVIAIICDDPLTSLFDVCNTVAAARYWRS